MYRHQLPDVFQHPTPDTHNQTSSSIRPSKPKTPEREGLLARLKSESVPPPPSPVPVPVTVPAPAQESKPEAATINPTAAFFDRLRVTTTRPEASAVTSHKHQQRAPALSEPDTPEPPLATALRENIAEAAEKLHTKAFTDLGDAYEELAGIMAATRAEDESLLAVIESSHGKVTKPLAETVVRADYTDAKTRQVLTREIYVGEGVASFCSRIDTLESEVDRLWGQWEAAQGEVDAIFMEVTSDNTPGGCGDVVAAARASLAEDMGAFGAELENILGEAMRSVKDSEKGFKKRIDELVQGMVQQYFLVD